MTRMIRDWILPLAVGAGLMTFRHWWDPFHGSVSLAVRAAHRIPENPDEPYHWATGGA